MAVSRCNSDSPDLSCLFDTAKSIRHYCTDIPALASMLTIIATNIYRNVYIHRCRESVHFDTLVSVVTLLGSGNLTTNCAPFCIGLEPLFGGTIGLGAPG